MSKEIAVASGLAQLSMDRVTTATKIADAISELILQGDIRSGTPLREEELRSTLAVSRNTVREALRLLGSEGLVTHHPYRGVAVTELTTDDVADIFRARKTLELCGVAAATRITKPQVSELEAARVARDQAATDEDWAAAFEADMQFHALVVSLIGSPRVNEFFVSLLRQLRLAFYIFGGLKTEGRTRDREQHARIADLLTRGELEECRHAVDEHLADSERILLDLMQPPVANEQEPASVQG